MFPKSLQFQPISTTQEYCVSGDVVIHPGAAIAPGVLLQADEGSRIVIRSGVCIGLGCVVHAHHGTITINEGSNLGAGVLLIGDVTIGARACLGAGVTVLNDAVDAGKILESGLVLGDQSRRVEEPTSGGNSSNSSNGSNGSASQPIDIDQLINSIPTNDQVDRAAKSNYSPYSSVSNSATPNPAASNPVVSSAVDSNPVEPNPVEPNPVEPNPVEPNPAASAPSVSTPPVSTPPVSTWKDPVASSSVDESFASSPSIENPPTDTSGNSWQTCDPNPWDPTDRPPGETTCQVTSKPKDANDFNPNLYSHHGHSSVYPPYQPPAEEKPSESETAPDGSIVPANQAPKAVYGQAYVQQMLGKMMGR